MPGPSSVTLVVTTSFSPEAGAWLEASPGLAAGAWRSTRTVMRLPAGVYLTALLTRLTSTCTIRRASTLTRQRPREGSAARTCSATLGSTWRRASSTTSSMSSSVRARCMPPPVRRVIASRFSTVAASQRASSRMERSSWMRRSGASAGEAGAAGAGSSASSSTSAAPPMDVSGVRRSCEIERKRLALSCSFLARTMACSRFCAASSRPRARLVSPATARAMSRSPCESGSPRLSTANTPRGPSFSPTGR